jgi:murein DD-endopeptidase MepM/ murein hydrolase activator NlpD
MKFITKISIIMVALVLMTGIYTIYEYNQIIKTEPKSQVFTFNNQALAYETATVQYHILGGLISFYHTYNREDDKTFFTDQIENTLDVHENTEVKVTTPDQKVTYTKGSQILAFEEDGEYEIELEDKQDGTTLYYKFLVNNENLPKISISNLSPVQGEVLIIEISNIKQKSTLEIQNHFSPSSVLQQTHTARFYLPIEFKASATTYPLTITINNKPYTSLLEVKAYEFNEQHFSIDTELIKNTSGNPLAVNEFKATMGPLYETSEPIEYWQSNFIIPVANASISSNFGDKRYINGSKTPSRHGGIDYAISCGTDVSASNSGKVDYAGFLILTGNTVVIDHGLGLKTHYYHMEDLNVKTGDLVNQGKTIGHVGTTGVSTGCHLHFQAMIKTQQFNPNFLYSLD